MANLEYVLGTDSTGRDVLSRVVYGARISFFVGLAAVGLGGGAGTILGLTAGYLGGRVDDLIMRLADIQLAYPFILFAIMILTILGEGVLNLILVLGVGQWVTYARIARAETLVQREREFVEAARASGASEGRIMLRTILPNIPDAAYRHRLLQRGRRHPVRSVAVFSRAWRARERAHLGAPCSPTAAINS